MFEYVQTTGQLIHRQTIQGGKQAGQPAGSPHNAGYLQIMIDRKKYLVHRLIWVYHYGEWPNQIDHANGERSDNRIENLRNCNHGENNANRKMGSNNTCGYKGVFLDKRDGVWFAGVAGEYIGRFKTKEEAALAYDAHAKRKFDEFALTNSDLGNVK